MSEVTRSVCLRVSGAVAPSAPAVKPISPDVTVVSQIGGKHGSAKAVNAGGTPFNGLCVLRQAHDPAAQFLDTGTRNV